MLDSPQSIFSALKVNEKSAEHCPAWYGRAKKILRAKARPEARNMIGKDDRKVKTMKKNINLRRSAQYLEKLCIKQ